MTENELYLSIRKGEIDPNNQESFVGTLIKGFLQSINDNISIRNTSIPHIIQHTGDPTMMLEVKGQDLEMNSIETTNENYIYNVIPRCVVHPKGINIIADQVSNPYSKGSFQMEYEDLLVTFAAEYRRIPFKMSFDLTYLIDTYTDYLELCQQVITKLLFVRQFSVVYMGKKIDCSYQIPTDFDADFDLEFGMDGTDSRHKKVDITIEVETNIPVFDARTAIPSDQMISNVSGYGFDINGEQKRNFGMDIYKDGLGENKPHESL